MKKKLLILFGILLTMVTLPAIRPAQASVNWITWLPPYAYINNYDEVAYEDGSTVELAVSVRNDMYTWGFNVSQVVLNFYGLGINKTIDVSSSPEKIAWLQTKVYTISFTADATEFLMGTMEHEYNVIIENVNSTTTPRKLLTPWTVSYYTSPQYCKFRVITAEQSDVSDLNQELSRDISYYPWNYFESVEARQLAFDATTKYNLGNTEVNRGDYAAAKTYFQAGIDLYKQALAAEKDYDQTWEDAELNTTLTQNAANMVNANSNMTWAEADMTRAKGEAEAAVVSANGTRLQGEAALMNAYGFYAIGIGFAIGWSLIGIGVIVYALRKPKPA